MTVTVTVAAGAVAKGVKGPEPGKLPSPSIGSMLIEEYGKGCRDGCPSVSN